MYLFSLPHFLYYQIQLSLSYLIIDLSLSQSYLLKIIKYN